MTSDRNRLLEGIEDALSGRWNKAHQTAQSLEGEQMADWLHAILHKIEGDEANARYWYRRAGQSYEAWDDPMAELQALKANLTY